MHPVADIRILPLAGMPLFAPGVSIAAEILAAIKRQGETLRGGDICVVAQKIVSKAEGRLVHPAGIEPSPEALRLAQETGRDAAMLELTLRECAEILRARPEAVIARHRTGHVLANAGIDASNVSAESGEETVLLWPEDPDKSARAIRAELAALGDVRPAVVIADSMGRAWRIGTVGTAIGCAGLTVLDDRRGTGKDLFGRTLQATVIAVADAVAAAATLAMGEGDEGTPVVLLRGWERWVSDNDGPGAVSGLRPVEQDMFR